MPIETAHFCYGKSLNLAGISQAEFEAGYAAGGEVADLARYGSLNGTVEELLQDTPDGITAFRGNPDDFVSFCGSRSCRGRGKLAAMRSYSWHRYMAADFEYYLYADDTGNVYHYTPCTVFVFEDGSRVCTESMACGQAGERTSALCDVLREYGLTRSLEEMIHASDFVHIIWNGGVPVVMASEVMGDESCVAEFCPAVL